MQIRIANWLLLAAFSVTGILAACSNQQDSAEPLMQADPANIEVARKMYKTLLAGDMEGAFSVMAENIRWIYYGGKRIIPFSGEYVGHEGVAQFFDDYSSVAEPLGMELQSFYSSGETVFVTGIENSRILATDKSYAAPWVHVLKFADGKIVSYEEYIDSALVAAAFE